MKIVSFHRFLLEGAKRLDAIIVSNDKFRDLENKGYDEIITKRVLPFQFLQDHFIPAQDPLGREGPSLKEFLKAPHSI